MNIKKASKLAIFICAATALTVSLINDKKNKEATEDREENEQIQ